MILFNVSSGEKFCQPVVLRETFQLIHPTLNFPSVSSHSCSYCICVHADGAVNRLLVMNFDVLLTVHLSIILVINQLDAQNLVL